MIWIKVESIPGSENLIYLPHDIAETLPPEISVHFGLREAKACIKAASFGISKKNSFENCLEVKCSQTLIDQLLINDTLTYQMFCSTDAISIGPVVGLLMGEQYYYYHSRHMKEFTDAMAMYEKTGGLFFTFKVASIDWDEMCIYGLYYSYPTKQWEYGRFPMPLAVFRRAFQTKDDSVDKLKVITHNKVFNSIKLDKWEMYSKLKESKTLDPYLPETGKLNSIDIMNDFLEKYGKIIIKPAGLSRGRGICIIGSTGESIKVSDYRNSKSVCYFEIPTKQLLSFLLEGRFFESNYIIQPYLSLATINDSPFDIRIVMQKNEKQEWQCSGIECRLAGSTDLLTNISRGGQALAIVQASELAFGPAMNPIKFKNDVISIAMDFCSCMDKTGELFAEFGLDLAVDINKRYWFIEANVRPTFKGFRIMDYDNYLHICCMPILYATSLAGFGKKGVKNETKV